MTESLEAPERHLEPDEGRDILQRAHDAAALYGPAGDAERVATRQRLAREGMPAIVVVGETNRGKSSLVNALVGESLSPVGTGETTALTVNFIPTDDDYPLGFAWIEFNPEAREEDDRSDVVFPLERVPIDELASWVGSKGEKLGASIDRPPRQAFVAVEATRNAIIVDTPGSGGLVEAHAARAIASAATASLLVVVTDATGRMTRPALEFLSVCASFVESVVLVVNKIDLTPSWEVIAEENRKILQGRDPRLGEIDIVGVSARQSLRALAEQDAERKRSRLAMSRMDELDAVLDEQLTRISHLPDVNALRQYDSILAKVKSTKLVERDLVAGSPTAASDLEQRSRDLESKVKHRKEYHFDLNERLDEMVITLKQLVRLRVRELNDEWRVRIQSRTWGISNQDFTNIGNEFNGQREGIAQEMKLRIEADFNQVMVDLFQEVGLSPPTSLTDSLRSISDGVDGGSSRWEPSKTALNPGSALGSAMMGARWGPDPVSASIFALINVTFGQFLHRRTANRNAFLEAIARGAKELGEELEQQLQRAMSKIKNRGRREFDRQLDEAIQEAKKQKVLAERAAAQSATERKNHVATVQRDLTAIAALQVEIASEISRLKT
jgi:GTPase SAR1 family protein